VDFFPKTFLYKTPPALLAALAASLGLLAWRFRALAPAAWVRISTASRR